MKKLISVLLIVAMLATLIACASQDEGGGGDTPGGETKAGETTVAPDDAPKGLAAAGLPSEKFDGETFTFLSASTADWAWWRVDTDEISGEVLNDAIYNRNKKIEEVYGVTIEVTKSDNFQNDVQNAVNANETVYTSAFGPMNAQLTLGQSGYLKNLYDAKYIDLEKEWWDESLTDGLTLFNKLYFACGDISPAMNLRVYSLVFNKDLCRELGLDLPYQHVLDGTWTLEVFSKYIQDVNFDVNGDSTMDYDDRWGYFSQNGNSYMMYFSGGGRITENDEDGVPQLVITNEKFVNLATQALEISFDQTKTLMADKYVSQNGGSWSAASAWFAAGGSLMRSSVFEPVPRDYRTMETDFGVLPYPKFDENQDRYYTLPESTGYVVSIPISANTDFSSLILEALAAESTVTVTPALYDVCLNGKIIRDNESEQMLDIIFGSKVFDIGYIINLGGFTSTLTGLEQAASTDVVSKYTTTTKASQKTLDKLVADVAALEH